MIEEDTRRAVARHRSQVWLWVLLDKYRVGLQLLLSQQVCEMCFVIYYQEQKKKWWENVIFTIHVLSRLTALLTWAASLGWTSAVTCCDIYREYHAPGPVVFTLSYHAYIDFARPITQTVFHMKCNQIQLSFYGVLRSIFYQKLKNVSCEYDRLNGWNSTLQAAWYIRHVRWTCLFYVSFITWCFILKD